MLPVFSADSNGNLCVKPVVQEVFEQLFNIGIREFCFIVGREKRAIQDHFKPDYHLVDRLNGLNRNGQALQMDRFFAEIEESTIVWLEQPRAEGFGRAVLLAERFAEGESFFVNAGDSYVTSDLYDIPKMLAEMHQRSQADATLTLQEVEDASQYGVAETLEVGDVVSVKRVVEKPTNPVSKLAIVALYAFTPALFAALEETRPGKGGEVQLTDAIQTLIDTQHRVQAIRLRSDDIHVDIGTPENYWKALRLSHGIASYRLARIETGLPVRESAGYGLSNMTEAASREVPGHACEVCMSTLLGKDDILCTDCSRAFTLVLELLRSHPDLDMHHLLRIRDVFQWRLKRKGLPPLQATRKEAEGSSVVIAHIPESTQPS